MFGVSDVKFGAVEGDHASSKACPTITAYIQLSEKGEPNSFYSDPLADLNPSCHNPILEPQDLVPLL